MPDAPAFDVPESWHLDSGLREDMVLTVTLSYFAPHADYMDGKVLMLWLIGIDENEEPVDVRMSVGADWQTADGNTITHPTKRKQHINKNTIYGHWISHCFEIPELGKTLVSRGDPTDARIWKDLILHLQTREIKFGRNLDPQERLMPTEFMGIYGGDTPSSTVPISAPAPSSPLAADAGSEMTPAERVAAAKAAKAQESALSNGSPLYTRALDLAKLSPDFATFLAQALDDSDILADDELAEQCADQSKVWATAHAG